MTGARIAIVATIAGLLAFGAGLLVFDQDRDAVIDSGSTSSSAIATSTTTGASTSAPDGAMPSTFVAVTDDGRVVVVEVASGRELRQPAAAGDPTEERDDEDDGPGPNVIDAVALAANRSTVFFSQCCEPAAGVLERVPFVGGQVDGIGSGYAPAPSSDGRFVAIVNPIGFEIRDLVGDEGKRARDDERGGSYQSIALSPDGSLVAADFVDDDKRGVVVARIADLPGSEQDDPPPANLKPLASKKASWWFPVFRADGRLVVVEQCCGLDPKGEAAGRVLDPATGAVVASFRYPAAVIDQDYDPSGTWLITTHADGSVRWQGKGQSGTLGSGYRSADW